MFIPPHLSQAPRPTPDACVVSERLHAIIRSEIDRESGFIPFARFMELALYTPRYGYYAGGAGKLGSAGDFVTAPEISPLFARTLARQVAQLVGQGLDHVLEFGGGTGTLAAGLLAELDALGAVPGHYAILEPSPDLRQRAQMRIAQLAPALGGRVQWLERLPLRFEGIVIANEVLDAMPVHVVRQQANMVEEMGVALADDRFVWSSRPAIGEVLTTAAALRLSPGYVTEIGLARRGWMRSVGAMLGRGAMLLVDYGFPAAEYYHPQRSTGTLMCHYRHHAHDDALCLPGLQDITAHVDFSAVAAAAAGCGLDLLGYASQTQFLINCGITTVLAQVSPADAGYLRLAAQAQTLLSPAEMGELFKVIAFGRGIDGRLIGFARGDRSHAL